jgi:hypothetical protein
MKQHHFEVYVATTDDGAIDPGVEFNSENSATWWDGTVWDTETEQWGDDAPAFSENACTHLVGVLDFPLKVIRIFEQWTDGDGWDINIMSDIMAELIALGFVDARQEIAQ